MTISSMYVRVKREKITYFIQADPSDTILELKEKLQELIDQVRGRREGERTPLYVGDLWAHSQEVWSLSACSVFLFR